MTLPHSDFPLTDNGWAADGDATTGRRRRAAGERAFEREASPDNIVDREDIVAVPVAPQRRVVSLSVAVFTAMLGFALVFGGYTEHKPYGLIIFFVQLLFVLSWTVATRPPGRIVVATVGVVCAAAADLALALPVHATLAPLGYVTAGGFALGAVGQLLRRDGREKVTESLGATLVMVVGVMAYASLIVLSRHPEGPESIVACMGGGAVGIVVARLLDVVLPNPRTTPQVARGTFGIIIGAMAGTIAAGFAGGMLKGLSPSHAVIAGLITTVAAVLADLGAGYAEASREIDGEVSALWVVRHIQPPLAAFALAAPVAYAMSVMVLVPSLT